MMTKATYTAITLPALQAVCLCLELFCVCRNLGLKPDVNTSQAFQVVMMDKCFEVYKSVFISPDH